MSPDRSKHAVCLQHVRFEGPGVFKRLLEKCGYQVEQRVVPEAGLPAGPGEFLLVMGGPMSVNDPDPWINEELTFIRQAVNAGVPYLGICLGSQFLAKALGAKVYPGPALEMGMTAIRLTSEGAKDAAFRTAPDPWEVFEWHGEVFDLPDGAVALAVSDVCLQAFRYGERAYGILFHAELERSGIEALCRECPADLARANRSAREVFVRAEPHLHRLHAWAGRLIQRLAKSG